MKDLRKFFALQAVIAGCLGAVFSFSEYLSVGAGEPENIAAYLTAIVYSALTGGLLLILFGKLR